MHFQSWIANSLTRQFPHMQAQKQRKLKLLLARNERGSFQVAFQHDVNRYAEVELSLAAPAGWMTRVRRVGTVTVPTHNADTEQDQLDGLGHIPGYVPDPLFPETRARFVPNQTHAFWVDVTPPASADPGTHTITATLLVNDEPAATVQAAIEVSPVTLEARKNFNVTHWFYADTLADWYKTDPFTEAFWPICEAYMTNYAQHGCDTIYVPMFTPPLDGVKRPTQLLKVTRRGRDRYEFDWSNVLRWIKTAQKCGITHFEWTHLFTQWGVAHALRIYDGAKPGDQLLWPADTAATAPVYRKFLSQLLPQLHNFVTQHKLLDRSWFHLADEPRESHLENYRAARTMLRELAPWMSVMDALSNLRSAREKLTDLPVASIDFAKQFIDENIPIWVYYCCGPRGKYLNRLLDTPLSKVRMNGWLFYRFQVQGFLHWGYNYWHKCHTQQLIDPFHTTDGLMYPNWAFGDPFVVYPGPDGPIDSMRWEVFAQSLQDYALLQQQAVDANGRLLAPLRDFDDFPWTQDWITRARRQILKPRSR